MSSESGSGYGGPRRAPLGGGRGREPSPGNEVALITGASSGIGEAFARRLARDGKNLVVVARRVDRLEALAGELSQKHGVAVHVIGMDLDRPEAAREIVAEIERLNLTVDWLVNNAAFGTLGRFHELPVERELSIVRVNVMTHVELTGRLLPGMVARARGAVITVSSLGAFLPGASFATYTATKAFLASFSDSLSIELKGSGVHVLCLCPGFTRTEFQDHLDVDKSKIPDFLWMHPDEVVDQAVRAVGKKTQLVNGAVNNVIKGVISLLPRAAVMQFSDGLKPEEPR